MKTIEPNRLAQSPRMRTEYCSSPTAAVTGLMVEWFLIGNSPWGNPDASQIGMAAYWACLVVVPLIVIDPDLQLRRLKRAIAIYAAVYSAAAVAAWALLPGETWGAAYHLWSVVFGYLGLAVMMMVGYLKPERLTVRSES